MSHYIACSFEKFTTHGQGKNVLLEMEAGYWTWKTEDYRH